MKLENTIIEKIKTRFNGQVILPGDAGYDESRAIWNAMFDRKPAIILKARNADDVASAVKFGRDNGLLIAVKGGGHNSAGNAVCDNGLVIDLSGMQEVDVDADNGIIRVQGGCLLGTVDLAIEIRTGCIFRYHIPYRGWRTHPGWWVWLDQQKVRTFSRQPAFGRSCDGRRENCNSQPI